MFPRFGDQYLVQILVYVSCIGAAFGGENDADFRFQQLRKYVTDQPRTFDNEIYFMWDARQIVRSDRFTGQSNLFGDFDGDNDVDLHDYNAMQICYSFSGPGIPTPPACDVFCSDEDGDIDLEDIGAFMRAFTGSLSGVVVEAGGLVPIAWKPGPYYSGEPGTGGNNALNGIAAQAGYTQDDLWYEWSVASHPEGTGSIIMSNSSRPATAYTILLPVMLGSYVFELEVTNLITLEFGMDTVALNVVACLGDSDCDDGLYCNGIETCDLDTLTCVEGGDPCADLECLCAGEVQD
ncbi:unnamed protein product, partial [marine sediment metagenome]